MEGMPGQVPTETEGVNPSSGKPHFVIFFMGSSQLLVTWFSDLDSTFKCLFLGGHSPADSRVHLHTRAREDTAPVSKLAAEAFVEPQPAAT